MINSIKNLLKSIENMIIRELDNMSNNLDAIKINKRMNLAHELLERLKKKQRLNNWDLRAEINQTVKLISHI